MFLVFFLIGLVGFVTMVLLSALGGHGSSHGHSHHEAGHTGHHHAAHQAGHDAHHLHPEASSPWLQILAWFSPRTLFTLSLGFGACGLALERLPLWMAIPLALLGAIALEGLLVKPYWNALLGFASQPAQTLEALEGRTAEAVTRFNHSGEGLVKLELDGQERQVLGVLERAQQGKPVAVGEVLRVVEVKDNGSVVLQKR